MAMRAVLVGINQYANSRFNLRGCLYDIESLARLLSAQYAFGPLDFEYLRDSTATRDNILSRLNSLLTSAQSGDTLVFAVSGHGTQVRSTDANEPDLKDECVVPYEATYSSLIRDNELYEMFNTYVDDHLKFTAIFDICHSGSITRQFGIDPSGLIVEEVINRCLQVEDITELPTRTMEVGPYNVLSACADAETAADLREAGPERLPRGAFSYALHDFLASNRDSPVAIADPQIAAGILAVSPNHRQTPNYQVINPNSPLIRH